MSEVKYAIAILKEKLANADRHNLAYQRLSIAEMEAIWGTLEKSDKDCATLKAERDALAALADALAALAEERRQFIVNGVEMGDILLPVIDGDPAIGIHERCLLKPKFAYGAYLNSVRAEGIHFAANHILAAWKSCLIKATPAEAADVSGAILSALEFLPKANPEEFKRDYADQVRADIAELLRAGKDGE